MAIVTPYLATDAIIKLLDKNDNLRGIVLIERKNKPHGFALPGGFVERGERVEEACIREMKEETGLNITIEKLHGIYDAPNRDPRFHTVSAVYLAHSYGMPQAGDDAKKTHIVTLESIPFDLLVFDHAKILRDFLLCRV